MNSFDETLIPDRIPGYILSIVELRILVAGFPIPPQAAHVVVLSRQQLHRLQKRMATKRFEKPVAIETSRTSGVEIEKTSVQNPLTASATDLSPAMIQSQSEFQRSTSLRPLPRAVRVLRDLFQIKRIQVYTMYDCGLFSILPEELFQEILMTPSIDLAEPKEEIHYEI